MVVHIVLVGVITQYWIPSFVHAHDSGVAKWGKEYRKHIITPTSSDSKDYEESNITSSDYNDDISSPEIPSDFSQKYFWSRSTTPKEPNSDEATEVQDVESTARKNLKKGKRSKREADTTGNTRRAVVKRRTRKPRNTTAKRRTRKPRNTTAKRRTRKPRNTTAKRRTRKPRTTTTESSGGDITVPRKRYATRISFFGEPVVIGSIEEEPATAVRKEIPNTTPHMEGPIKMITKISFWGGIVEVPAEHVTKKSVVLDTVLPTEKSSEGSKSTTERKPSLDVTKLAFGMGFMPFPSQTQEKPEAYNVLKSTTASVAASPTASVQHSTTITTTTTTANFKEEYMTTVRMAP